MTTWGGTRQRSKSVRTEVPTKNPYNYKGFGFLLHDRKDPWGDPKVRLASVKTALGIIDGSIEPRNDEDTLQCISNAKGLFSRVARGDRPDWFTVASQLGYPSAKFSNEVGNKLASLRKALKNGDMQAFSAARKWLLDEPAVECLTNYVEGMEHGRWNPPEQGWAYVFWSSDESDILAVGTTDDTIFDMETQLNREFRTTGRYGIMAAWLVNDTEEAARLIRKQFDRKSLGADFYRMELGEAKQGIQTLLEKHDLHDLSPWHGEDGPELSQDQENEPSMAPAGP